MKYQVDIDSLRDNFPEGFEVPTLLLDFADWLGNQRDESIGQFLLQSDRVNDFWIENGADLHPCFATFARDTTGGQVAYWLYDGLKTASPPIVLLGSEGELEVLSDSLEGFLTRLAEGQTGLLDFDTRPSGNKEGKELTAWLGPHATIDASLPPPKPPNLESWINRWSEEQCNVIDHDDAHLAIAERLRKFLKPNAKPWESANFDVLFVGTRFRMWYRMYGPQPMPPAETEGLEDLFRDIRRQRALKVPERGLWFSAFVRVGAEGGAWPRCNFMDAPEVQGKQQDIPRSDYELDLREFPRSKHWMPKWLQ